MVCLCLCHRHWRNVCSYWDLKLSTLSHTCTHRDLVFPASSQCPWICSLDHLPAAICWPSSSDAFLLLLTPYLIIVADASASSRSLPLQGGPDCCWNLDSLGSSKAKWSQVERFKKCSLELIKLSIWQVMGHYEDRRIKNNIWFMALMEPGS